MKKLYLGSGRLQNNFKMIRVQYANKQEVEQVKEGVMQLMSGYLQKYGGYLSVYAASSSTSWTSRTATNCWCTS